MEKPVKDYSEQNKEQKNLTQELLFLHGPLSEVDHCSTCVELRIERTSIPELKRLIKLYQNN